MGEVPERGGESEFYSLTQDRPPHELLAEAFRRFPPSGRDALDLGCGAGRDTQYLAEQGYLVTAVDASAEVGRYLAQLPNANRVRFVNERFADFEFGTYDLVNAQYALPFNPPDSFPEVMDRMRASIRPGGLFVGQLFGERDEWNRPGAAMTFVRRDEVPDLFADMEVLELRESEVDGTIANGTPKHWHLFDVIARKRNQG